MKDYLVLYLVIALSCPLVVSCIKDVSLDAMEKPQVVVVGILQNSSEQKLQLSFTKGASRSEAPPLTEAVVTLFDENTDVGQFRRTQGNEWTLSYAAIPGHNYRLEVQVPGYELITASQRLPRKPRIAAIGVCHYAYRIPGLHIPDLLLEPFVPNAEEFDSLPLGEKVYFIRDITETVFIYAMNYDAEKNTHTLADEICTNYNGVDSLNIMDSRYVPPQRSDIPNPYIGGSSLAKLYPNLEGQRLHKQYLRFPPRDLPHGWWFTISGSFSGKYNCKDFYQQYYGDYGIADPLNPDEGYLEAIAVSEDMDCYLLEAFQRQRIKESSDLSTIYLRDNIFTNIQGGLGILGAASFVKLQWSGEYDYVDDGREHRLPEGDGYAFALNDDIWKDD